ncbi:MAG: carbohydrate porin [Bacteroidetes bacterium]|nr:carbohydrate porin [Bacteroidota bacterium]
MQPETAYQQAFNLHFQTTYIYQYSARFHAPYSGPNSLDANEEKENSLTLSLFGGMRLWKGAEAYVNPEIAGGSGLSGAVGMAGSSNGETTRIGDPAPTLYLGRAYISQTFSIGPKETDTITDDANTLAGIAPKNYLRLTVGKYSLGDQFDQNQVSNSPRTQFMNWALMNTGAWDYAANVRGYTLAATATLSLKNWSYKIAAAALPKEANGDELDMHLSKSIAWNSEIDRQYKFKGKSGNIRLLFYQNQTHMGNYAQAISLGAALGQKPDIIRTRRDGRTKTGFAISADQKLNDNLSAFLRAGWNDGKNETWCFTEIDQSLAIGAQLKGTPWKRNEDMLGVACVVNGLSREHRDYIAAGGDGFMLGDGALNYSPESILETYYSAQLRKEGLWLSADYQLCLNPGYNKDRGPASIASIRLHVAI